MLFDLSEVRGSVDKRNGFGLTNLAEKGVVLDVCLCLGCGAVGGECGLGPGSGIVGWYISGFFVQMAGPVICILCYANTCAS